MIDPEIEIPVAYLVPPPQGIYPSVPASAETEPVFVEASAPPWEGENPSEDIEIEKDKSKKNTYFDA